MLDIFSKFTTHFQHTLAKARAKAEAQGRSLLDPSDLILALATERGSLSAEILDNHGLSPLAAHEKLGRRATEGAMRPMSDPLGEDELVDLLSDNLSPAVRRVVEHAVMTAWKHQHHYIGTEHLLYALTVNNEPEVSETWQRLGVDVGNLRSNVSSVLRSTSKFPDLTEAFVATETKEDEAGKNGETPALDFFCTDLTSAPVQSKIDPVVGREREIQRLVNILGRRTKNNPLLLGDPGVGKTAIVEGLAKRIHEGKVPEFLQDKRIFALDLGLVIAGTMYRGEFEGRLKQILDELKSHPEIILFIDEVHTIVGTGGAPGTLDLANLLKPALAKGLVRCIGATTQEEYRKSIESDAALERRFQVVQVAEPSPEETLNVLKGIRSSYEEFHGVKITDEAIEAAVAMSERYLPEKFLPDKAIDLIDEAASSFKTAHLPDDQAKKMREFQANLKDLREAKEAAIRKEDFVLATSLKQQEATLSTELTKLQRGRESKGVLGTISRQEIAQVVAHMTGVAATELLSDERHKLRELESTLSARVVGQDQAVAAVAKSIRRGRMGLASPQRPLGSFLFLGPSGVGKTELAKAVAETVFEDPSALVRLDMSEFGEAFNISKLIGAPAGYVGYKDSNKLTDIIRKRPASVVLFDEIEKAHPDVFNLLLQVLDEGHLTDAAGKQVNFKNSLIILTSNLGLEELTREASLGFASDGERTARRQEFEEVKEQLMAEVKRFFRPEFLNRLDAAIVFNPLTERNLTEIVKLQVAELNQRLAKQKLALTVKLARDTAKWVARTTFSPEEGARGIRRYLQEHVEDPLTQKLFDGAIKLPAAVTVSEKSGRIQISAERRP